MKARQRFSKIDYPFLINIKIFILAFPSRVPRLSLRSPPIHIKLLTKRKFKLHCLVRSSSHCLVLKFAYVESFKKVVCRQECDPKV